ncbi:MAG: malate synthase A, partial [Actinomycetota bacterium]
MTADGVDIRAPVEGRHSEILTDEALAFLARLQREFDSTRKRLLSDRAERQERFDEGELPDFPSLGIREKEWSVPEVPGDLMDRRVEITGPTDRKMTINALNSGAKVFMADFEDANSPVWDNMVSGQANLIDAVEGTIGFTSPEGKEYRLEEDVATLVVRPRGWHLDERHVLVDGEPVAASLFDFGLYFFHNAR